jgi:hypothetical protein
MISETKRSKVGRPAKTARRRPNLTIRITEKMYGDLQAAAEVSGRSLSEEVEQRLERAAAWERVFESVEKFKAAFKADTKQLEYGDTEAALVRRGYGKVIDPQYGGHIWIPPERHQLPRSGFLDPTPEEPNNPERTKKTEAEIERVKAELDEIERRVRTLRTDKAHG